jgi:DNA-binding NarL/FixJ family response regulator
MVGESENVVLVVDRHPLTRDGICDVIAAAAQDLRVVAAASPDQLPKAIDAGTGHLVVLYNGNDRAPDDARVASDLDRLRQALPGAPIALLSPAGGPPVERLALRGHMPPSLTADVMVAALRLILAGGSYFPPANLTAPPPRSGSAVPPLSVFDGTARRGIDPDSLTTREAEVLTKLCQGKANKIIAYELDLSENTVKVHVYRIMKKLGAANRTEVVSMVQRLAG